MKKLVFALGIILIVSLGILKPVNAAEHLTADNFADPHPVITPEKDYYKEGDTISVTYTIAPKTEDDAVKVMGDVDKSRFYDVYTGLNYPSWEVIVDYVNGPRIYPEIKPWSNHAVVEVKYWYTETGKGLKQILVNITGKVPKPERRFEEKTILWVNVSDADEDALPSVTISIVDYAKFTSDMDSIKEKINNLESKINEFKEMGYDVDKAKEYLEEARSLLTSAEDLYKNQKFSEADSKLNYAEENLSDVDLELNKSEVEYNYGLVKDSFKEVQTKLLEAEYYINDAKERGVKVIDYEIELAKLKAQADSIESDISDVDSYIKDEKYDLAKDKLQDIDEKIKNLENSTQALITNLTATNEKKEDVISQLTGYLVSYLPYIVAIVVAAVAVLVFVSRRRGGKWDELR